MAFTLLQTSDLHGKLPPPSLERLNLLRAENSADFLVDSGDVVGAGNLGFRPDEPIWDAFNALGYTAMAVGNRDAHLFRSVMARKLAPANCPVLCANLQVEGGPNPTQPSLVVTAGDGTRVAFFGLTTPMITREMWSRRLSDLLFLSPEEVARELVPRLRQQADGVVLLSHLGLRQDRRLAEAVPGIDLILGGHSHIELHRPEVVGQTTICQPGGFGKYATFAWCERDSDAWRVEARLEPLRPC